MRVCVCARRRADEGQKRNEKEDVLEKRSEKEKRNKEEKMRKGGETKFYTPIILPSIKLIRQIVVRASLARKRGIALHHASPYTPGFSLVSLPTT